MPPKGQELDDHYFGAIRERIAAFMKDVNKELWKLGVSAKTQHNEVAPAQHELAPIYAQCNVAVDHNPVSYTHLDVYKRQYRIKVTHDDQVIEDEFIFGMVTNSRSIGGFRNMVGKSIVFDDGEFEVTLIKTPKNPLALQEIIAAILIEQIDTKHMYTFKANSLKLESLEEIPWTLDGEFGGEHDEVMIENQRQKLKIMVPIDKVKSLMKEPDTLQLEEGIEED